jgi:tellurite resistance protein TerC
MTGWIEFSALVLVLLILDLGVLNQRSHMLSFREAATWAGALVTLAMAFGLVILAQQGTRGALEYYTGYLIELSLSVDNLFVFILIFQYFAVPAEVQPRVLKWGILGAIVLRGIMIAVGALMLERFTWIVYVFGGLLVITGARMAMERGPVRLAPERNPMVRLVRRLMPFSEAYDGARFFTRTPRGRVGTPLLLVLVVVEWSDLVFAIDSIPAIFAVTRDPFIVYSSNVFAILGLRALFFVLAGMLDRFRYLKPGVALVLVFIGAKMMTAAWVHIPTTVSLAVVAVTLAGSVILSLLRRTDDAPPFGDAPDPTRKGDAPSSPDSETV